MKLSMRSLVFVPAALMFISCEDKSADRLSVLEQENQTRLSSERQALDAANSSLKSENEALKKENAELKERVATLESRATAPKSPSAARAKPPRSQDIGTSGAPLTKEEKQIKKEATGGSGIR